MTVTVPLSKGYGMACARTRVVDETDDLIDKTGTGEIKAGTGHTLTSKMQRSLGLVRVLHGRAWTKLFAYESRLFKLVLM